MTLKLMLRLRFFLLQRFQNEFPYPDESKFWSNSDYFHICKIGVCFVAYNSAYVLLLMYYVFFDFNGI